MKRGIGAVHEGVRRCRHVGSSAYPGQLCRQQGQKRFGVSKITAFKVRRHSQHVCHAGQIVLSYVMIMKHYMPLPTSALSLATTVCFQPPLSLLQGFCLEKAQESTHRGALYSSREAVCIPYCPVKMAIRDTSIGV